MKSSEIREKMEAIAIKYSFDEVCDQLIMISQDEDFKIGFVGEYGTGKTTIINALLAEELLPTDDLPTTKAITEVKVGDNETFIVYEEKDQEKVVDRNVSKEEFKGLIAKSPFVQKGIALIRKRGVLNENIVLVDTPGLYSLSAMDEHITYGYLPFCDVIFIIQDLGSGAVKASTKSFIKQTKEQTGNLIRFIVNKEDEKSPQEREQIIREFKNELSDTIDNPILFSISAIESLRRRLSNGVGHDSIKVIEDHISNVIKPIVEEKVEIRKKNQMTNLGKSLIERLNNKIDMINWDDEEVDKKIAELEKKIRIYHVEKHNLGNRFQQAKYSSSAKLSHIIEQYSKKFMNKAITKKTTSGDFEDDSHEMSKAIQKSIVDDINELLQEISEKFEGFDIGLIGIDKDIVKTHLRINRIAVTALTALAVAWIVPGAFGPSGELNLSNFTTPEKMQTYFKDLKIQEWIGKGGVVLPELITNIAKERPISELSRYNIEDNYIQALLKSGYITMGIVAESSFERLKKKVIENGEKTKDAKIISKIHSICKQEGNRSPEIVKLISQASELFNKINPIDIIGRTITKWIGKDTFRKEITNRTIATLDVTYQGVERELHNYIATNIIAPQEELKSDLKAEKKAREKKIRDKESYLSDLMRDIEPLKKIVNNNRWS